MKNLVGFVCTRCLTKTILEYEDVQFDFKEGNNQYTIDSRTYVRPYKVLCKKCNGKVGMVNYHPQIIDSAIELWKRHLNNSIDINFIFSNDVHCQIRIVDKNNSHSALMTAVLEMDEENIYSLDLVNDKDYVYIRNHNLDDTVDIINKLIRRFIDIFDSNNGG